MTKQAFLNTCKKLMAVLARAKKSRQLVRINPSQEDILQKPELIPRPEDPPEKKRRRGRPPGSKNRPKASLWTIHA